MFAAHKIARSVSLLTLAAVIIFVPASVFAKDTTRLDSLLAHKVRALDRGKITVFLVAQPGKSARDISRKALTANGVTVIKSAGTIVKVTMPIERLTAVAHNVDGIALIRVPPQPQPLAVVSQGVSLTGADLYQASGWAGVGVKVAVIDVGFAGLAGAKASGDIPDSAIGIDCTLAVCTEATFSSGESSTHGTRVAEVVADMAPAAQIYLMKIGDPLDVKNAKDWAVSNGIKIINHSVGWYSFNFYDGACYAAQSVSVVCTAQEAVAQGILWVNAAGNDAQKSYSATYADVNVDGRHDQAIAVAAHAGERVQLYVTWDAWPTTNQDYDLLLFDSGDHLIATSNFNQTTVPGEPWEMIDTVSPTNDTYHVVVVQSSATAPHRFSLHSLSPIQVLTPAVAVSSIANPADATDVLTVGALPATAWTTGPQATYSSQGPTNAGVVKPDLVAPTSITTSMGSFAGTSTSAPYVAGAAAVVLSQHPDYTVAQLRAALLQTAIDMGAPGVDSIYGAGRLNLVVPTPVPEPAQTVIPTPEPTIVPTPTATPTPESAAPSSSGDSDNGGGGGGGEEPPPVRPKVKKGKVLGVNTLSVKVPDLFRAVYGRIPTSGEKKYWLLRVKDKPKEAALRGAMMYHKAHDAKRSSGRAENRR